MNNEPSEVINYKGYAIKVYQDDSCQSPDEGNDGDEGCFLVHYHRDFEVRRDNLITEEELTKWYNGEKIEKEKTHFIFLTYAYIHSGVSLSLDNGSYPFTDRWDTSRCGAVLVDKKIARTRAKALKIAEGLVADWNDYLSGNVWGYVAEDSKGNNVDSCWGFSGDIDKSGMIDEAKNAIDYDYEKAKKKHISKVKAMIKNGVPLEKRTMLLV